MRLDLFLSRVGVVKRRSVAKDLADNGMIKVNGRPAKPALDLNEKDIVSVSGKRSITIEILKIPKGSVKKSEREEYYKILDAFDK
jgi:ribosomal 50S subunit-recycling heat shock protein